MMIQKLKFVLHPKKDDDNKEALRNCIYIYLF